MTTASRTSRLGLYFFLLLIIQHSTLGTPNSGSSLVLSTARTFTGVEGTSLSVKCTAQVNTAPISLNWLRRQTTPAHDISQRRADNFSVEFKINELHRSDAGVYKCVMTRSDNEVEEKEMELLVSPKDQTNEVCATTQFRCKKSFDCIFQRYMCDGLPDCPDGTDEEDSICTATPCKGKFNCNNSRCVDSKYVCDTIDNCGDKTDEIEGCRIKNGDSNTYLFGETSVKSGEDIIAPNLIRNTPMEKDVTTAISREEGEHFNWLKTTVYTVIGCTVAIVILISFIVIIVFRIKMKRLRARRLARYIERQQFRQQGGTSSFDTGASDQDPFLAFSARSQFGNIIVNVNNGMQCVRTTDVLPAATARLHPLVDLPPPYSEIHKPADEFPPPPYSTIDRAGSRKQTSIGSGDGRGGSVGSSANNLSATNRVLGLLPAGSLESSPVGSELLPMSASSGVGISEGASAPLVAPKPHTRQIRLQRSSACSNVTEENLEDTAYPLSRIIDQRTSVSGNEDSAEVPRPVLQPLLPLSPESPSLVLPPSAPLPATRSTSMINSHSSQSPNATSPGSSNLMVRDGQIVFSTSSSSPGSVSTLANPISPSSPSTTLGLDSGDEPCANSGKLEVRQGQIILNVSTKGVSCGNTNASGVEGVMQNPQSVASTCELRVKDGKILFKR